MSKSFAEDLKSTLKQTTIERKNKLVSAEELKAQSDKIMSKSLSNTIDNNKETVVRNLDKSDVNSEQSDSSVSKVRKNIREFERRSSVCGESTVLTVQSVIKKENNLINCNINNNNNNTNNSNNNSIRMSKSCFEVDCCDNSSSGNRLPLILET